MCLMELRMFSGWEEEAKDQDEKVTDGGDWIKGTTIMGVESGQEGKQLVWLQKRR